jgi:CHAT domain-containing protein
MNHISILIAIIIFFSCLFAIDRNILKLNQEIEDISFKTQNFEFDYVNTGSLLDYYSRINELMEKCDKENYLIGESELLTSKIQIAIAVGEEDLIEGWGDNYKEKMNDAIKYGMRDRELYYSFLSLQIKIATDGFEFYRDKIEDLKEQANINNDYNIEAYILLTMLQNVSGEDYKLIDSELETLFSSHKELKNTYIYVAYQTLKGTNIMLEEHDDEKELMEDGGDFPLEIRTSFLRVLELQKLEHYSEALSILHEMNKKMPSNIFILSSIAENYLNHYNLDEDNQYLNDALKHALQAHELGTNNYSNHYILAHIYSHKKELNQSLVHLEKSLEFGNNSYKWTFEDPAFENLREIFDLHEIIIKYDKGSRANRCFNETIKYAKKLKLSKTEKLAEYRKFMSGLISYNSEYKDHYHDELLDVIEPIKKINFDLYRTEIAAIGITLTGKYNELAESLLTEYIELTENFLNENQQYIKNRLNSPLIRDNEDQTFEELRASHLIFAYASLANANLWLSHKEEFFKNQKHAIYYGELIGYSTYHILDQHIYLANEYSKIDDLTNSKKHIKKAERLFNLLPSSDSKMRARIDLFDHYFLYNYESYEKKYKKMINYLNNGIKEAIASDRFDYQYLFTIRRANIYFIIDQHESAYVDFINSYDLMKKYNNDIDYLYTDWRFFRSMVKHDRFDLIRPVIAQMFQVAFTSGDYIDSFKSAVQPMFNYVYKKTLLDDDYELLTSMILKFEEVEKSDYWELEIKLFSWQVELIYNGIHDDLEKSISLIPHYINLKDKVLNENKNNDGLLTTYFWLGRKLLSDTEDIYTDEFNKLFEFYEPLHWEYQGYIVSDSWFLKFIAYNNEQLYNKYINRILSYPLSKKRLSQKILHSNVLVNYWGNLKESIKLYEEVLSETKILGDLYQEIDVLSELAIRYAYNNQLNLSKRRYYEAYQLAKSLEYYSQLEVILTNMLDLLVLTEAEFYELTVDYLAISKINNSVVGQIQALGFFIDYFKSTQQPERAIEYIIEGISLKSTVLSKASNLLYLSFISDSWIFMNNDLTGKLVNPIKDWAYNDIKIEDPNIQRIVDELNYLKDFDLNTLDQDEVQEHPFIYLKVWNQSRILKDYWDKNFLQKIEFDSLLEFIANLDIKYKKDGLLNSLWGINIRLKQIEEWRNVDKFFGFGFNYEGAEDHNGFKITGLSAKSPAYNLFQLDDIILCNTCNEITRESGIEFMSSKIDESDVLLDKWATFTILRNGIDTLLVDIMPGNVQPNPYSEYPSQEVSELLESFLNISDELLNSFENVNSSSGFANSYREFLIAFPWRYHYTQDVGMSSDKYIELLDRYESISTTNLVNESLNHKENLRVNPLLMSEYHKYSERINQIQRGLQDENLTEDALLSLKNDREYAYNQLNYFENYNLENSIGRQEKDHFSFMDNHELFNQFDHIVRICSTDYLNNGIFVWNKANNETTFYYSNSEVDAEVQIKNLNQTITYTVNNNINGSLLNVLKEITKIFNGNSELVLKEDIKDEEWLIIPERASNFFPFELLQFRYESDTTQYHYLGEAVNITYAPSLSAYAELEKRKNSGKTKKSAILASANPETESSTSYMNNLFALRSEYGNIENVDKEIAAIETILENKKFLERGYKILSMNSENITEKKFKSADLENAKYIHIAAHGIHDDENPKYSGILLGRDKDDTEDGILQAHEIFPLNLNADLVTLSSCFSGFGEIDPNEGNLGIYRSFLLAGAKSVIISLWNVEDESTSILFSKFYEYLKEGNSKSKSLRLAKMDLKNNPKYSHPFYWAPFILMGES